MPDFDNDAASGGGGDLQYLSEQISEENKIENQTPVFTKKLDSVYTLVIPNSKKFVLTNITIKPITLPTDPSQVDAEIFFAGQRQDNVFVSYDSEKNSEHFSNSLTRALAFHGDGTRALTINVTNFVGTTPYIIYVRGFYVDEVGTATGSNIIYRPVGKIGLAAAELNHNVIRLTVTAPIDNGGLPITQYRWYRSTTQSDLSDIANIPSGTHSATVTFADGTLTIDDNDGGNNLADNGTYYYRVVAINSEGQQNSSFSDIASATTLPDVPDVTTSVMVQTVNENQIRVSAVIPEDLGGVQFSGLKIERSDNNGNTWTLISNDTGTDSFIDADVLPQVTYTYRVSIVNSVNKTSLPVTSSQITNSWNAPTLNSLTPDKDAIHIALSWTAPDSDIPFDTYPITNYTIERSELNLDRWSIVGMVSGSTTTFNDQSVLPVITYTYRVKATRNNTDSSYSNTSSQTLGFIKPSAVRNLQNVVSTDSQITIRWEPPLLDGGSAIIGYTIQYGTDSTFATKTDITHTDLNNLERIIIGLSELTTYYIRIWAYSNEFTTNDNYSNILSFITLPAVYGTSATNHTVPANQTQRLASIATATEGIYEFNNLTIENGATLIVNKAILKIKNDYTENGTGKIQVEATGCPGSRGGTTAPGRGGAQTAATRRNYQRSANPGTPATKTAPADPVMCTDLDAAYTLGFDMIKDTFVSRFRRIRGGRGSKGTAAQTSGNGGRSGTGGRWSNRWRVGTRGGNGGKAADGVSGVRGGGTFALFVNNIVNKITIDAKGLTGINGNRGTGAAGQAHGGASSRPGSTGQAGGAASTQGTLGSPGSDGGIVYMLYTTIPTQTISHQPTTGTVSYAQIRAGSTTGGISLASTSTLIGKNVNVIGFKLSKVGNPTGTATCNVYRTGVSQPYSFGSIDVSTLTTTSAINYFDDPDMVLTLQSGDRIVIEYSGGDASNYVRLEENTTPYGTGTNKDGTTSNTPVAAFELEEFDAIVDISGGIGGFNGGTNTGTHPTSTRAATGNLGVVAINKLGNLIGN